MTRILVADYGREDLLGLRSPLVGTLRAWGYEVVEAEHSPDVLAKVSSTQPDAVMLYDTLPEVEMLRLTLQQQCKDQGLPVLILHEKVQQMQFTDMVVVDPRYRLDRSPRNFDVQELNRLLDAAFPAGSDTSGRSAPGQPA